MEKFTVDYFEKKYEKIPDMLWCKGWLENSFGQHCALGFCGVTCNDEMKGAWGYTHTNESKALIKLLQPIAEKVCPPHHKEFIVNMINDGVVSRYQQETPKERMLAALRDVRAMLNKEQSVQVSDTTKAQSSEEAGKQKEKIRYVKVEIEEMELVEN